MVVYILKLDLNFVYIKPKKLLYSFIILGFKQYLETVDDVDITKKILFCVVFVGYVFVADE